jgi:DNA-binding NarL/FixJ family response regulator
VIVFSSLPEREYAFQVLREGASGFVSKTSDPQALLRTVRTAVCNSARSSASAARVLPSQGAQPRAMHETLSPREREIFMALARGRRVTEIGSALKLSKKTVSTYRQRILDKTGFTTNSELTRYALQHELLN